MSQVFLRQVRDRQGLAVNCVTDPGVPLESFTHPIPPEYIKKVRIAIKCVPAYASQYSEFPSISLLGMHLTRPCDLCITYFPLSYYSLDSGRIYLTLLMHRLPWSAIYCTRFEDTPLSYILTSLLFKNPSSYLCLLSYQSDPTIMLKDMQLYVYRCILSPSHYYIPCPSSPSTDSTRSL